MLRGLVVEGVTGSGKSTLLGGIQRQLADTWPTCTRLALSEHYTERVLEDLRATGRLDVHAILRHGLKLKAAVESVLLLRRGSKFEQRDGNAAIVVTIERWLGTHAANLSECNVRLDSDAENQMFQLTKWLVDAGLTIVVLELGREMLQQRLERTFAQRNDEWRRYINSLGGLVGATERYCAWQDALIDFY